MADATNLLKLGSADLVLRMLEAGVVMRDLTLENPIRAIREISHDVTGRQLVKLANGRELSALDLQREYFEKVRTFVARRELGTDPNSVPARVLDLWERTLTAVEANDPSRIATEIDWAIKLNLFERYSAKHNISLASARLAQLDLAYHDIRRSRGLYHLLANRGVVTRLVPELSAFEAKTRPPQTTRAKLRGDFIQKAQEKHRDYTVDWVHLKLNDQAQRTVLCKDPFSATDERVTRLIESM